jgi:hypothetical protein
MTLSIIPLWTSGWTVAAAHFALDHLAANLMALGRLGCAGRLGPTPQRCRNRARQSQR